MSSRPGHEWVVEYGRLAFVGRFLDANGLIPDRGSSVVIASPRGVEIGQALCPVDERYQTHLSPHRDGEILRLATPDDHVSHATAQRQAESILSSASDLCETLAPSLLAIDCEGLLESEQILLHGYGNAEAEVVTLCQALLTQHGLPVSWLDLNQGRTPEPAATAGCGKAGCGSTSGGGCSSCGTGESGCSSGGCSRGSAKSAAELTAYFAQLREAMESQTRRTSLH